MLNTVAADAKSLPNAGELQLLVDKLEEILSPPALKVTAVVATFRDSRRRAFCELDAVRERSFATFKKTPEGSDASVAAEQELAKATQQAEQSRKQFYSVKDREHAAWLAEVGAKLAEAAPTLLAVSALAQEAFTPLLDLYLHAIQRNYPLPRMLAAVPHMTQGLRLLIANLNEVTSPPQPGPQVLDRQSDVPRGF